MIKKEEEMNKIKKRTVEEIYEEMIKEHGCIPINLCYMLDPDIDYHFRMMDGLNEDLLGPIDKI